MPKARERGAVRATADSSRRTNTRAAPGVGMAVTWRAANGASLEGAMSRTRPDAELLALLVTLKQQDDIIAAIEDEEHHLPEGITDVSRDRERRLEQALDRRAETLECIIATPAASPAGLRVKAEALGLLALGCAYSYQGDTLEEIARYGGVPDRLALSLARDVLAWRAAA
jgi:hypothetical protein